MAKLSEKEVKDIEVRLLNGEGPPSGYVIDFSKNPPYRKYSDAELADLEKEAAAERRRAETVVTEAPVAVTPNAG